jgi:TonB family protein
MRLKIKFLFALALLPCIKAVGQNKSDHEALPDSVALAEFIYNNTHYPLMDYIKGVEGTAIYQVEIDSMGRIDNLRLDSTSGSLNLDREARRLIYEVTGKKRIKNTKIFVPINFKLEDNKIYELVEVEEKPEFPGGEAALIQFFAKNLRYPPEAAEMSIQGKVIFGFIVEKDGSIHTIEMLNSLDRFCDAEALRVIGRMPKWKPAKKDGKSVRVYYIFPVIFRLQ